MEQFYLELPSTDRKNEIIDYINEFVVYNSDINGIDKATESKDYDNVYLYNELFAGFVRCSN